MTAEREALLALADRVERAMEWDRELEHDIAGLFGEVHCVYPPGSIQAADGLWCVRYRAPHPYAGTKEPVPEYTRDMNAALALVPEGVPWQVRADPAGGFDTETMVHDEDGWWFAADGPYAHAATPALALTAAALRARAAAAVDD